MEIIYQASFYLNISILKRFHFPVIQMNFGSKILNQADLKYLILLNANRNSFSPIVFLSKASMEKSKHLLLATYHPKEEELWHKKEALADSSD